MNIYGQLVQPHNMYYVQQVNISITNLWICKSNIQNQNAKPTHANPILHKPT